MTRTRQQAGDAKGEDGARRAIVAACRAMNASGLNQGTSGNISVRSGGRMLITPSATAYDAMTPDTIAAIALDAADGAWEGRLRPSTEWRFHRDILRARPEIGAIVHAHAPHATALAIARRPIPACHYMVAVFGGDDIRCAPYARFGTAALSQHAVAALDGRMACLLANHGVIALGATLEKAMWHAVELETLARQYLLSLAAGGPALLTPAEMDEARAAMAGYGLASGVGAGHPGGPPGNVADGLAGRVDGASATARGGRRRRGTRRGAS